MNTQHFDALVIGAGAGGICAAARLAHLGYRTLLVEREGLIGGRASTRTVDGFLCNTGALVIELDGAVAQTYRDLGISLSLYEPKSAATVLRVGKRDINVTQGFGGWARSLLPHCLAAASRVTPGFRPKPAESTRAWLNRFTRNNWIHGLLNNTVGAMFAARTDDLPADVFIQYFTRDTSFKKIGMPVGGTIEVWKPLVSVIEAMGGEVWLDSRVSRLSFAPNGSVSGAIVDRPDGPAEISCHVAVSDAGPLATIELAGGDNVPRAYVEDVRKWSQPAAIITVHFASQSPLASFPCLAVFSKTRRLVYAGNFSAPELKRAPTGWFLYCAASVPQPPTGRFNVEEETELLLQDLRDHFPGFDDAKILSIDVTADDWPAQRAIAGFDQPQMTPIANLWNVGDGAKPWATGGTAACAESARIVVEAIADKYPLHMFQRRAAAGAVT